MSYERVGGTLMTNKENNFLKRRFKKFELSGPWEARFLGELVKLNPKGQLPQTCEYVDLESVVGTEMVSHRKVTRDTAPSRAQRLAQSGDLFYQTVRPYQKNNFLATNLNGDYVFSTGYAQLRPLISGYFLLSLVQNDRFVKSVLSRCTGTSYPSISADELSKIQVLVSNDEQELYSIGKLFQKLDRLIILHQHKLDKLKNLKKAYLSEMFPAEGERVPKLRFPGFEGEWEQKKLGEITTYRNGLGHEEKQSRFGNYELVNLNSISIDGGLKPSGRFIEEASETLMKNDLVMVLSDVAHGDLLGRVAVIPENDKFVLNQRVALLRHNGIVDIKYLFSFINAHQKYFKLQGAGSSQLNLSRYSVENFEVALPSVEEQKTIGNFLEKLDKSISLQQQKLDKLNDLKKAYLNELFV